LNTVYINAPGDNMIRFQYMIELGLRGIHPVFEPEEIRSAFDRNIEDLANVGPGTVSEINEAIRNILQAPDLESQRDLIQELDNDVRDILVHLYFQVIDRNLIEGNPSKH